MTGMGGPEGSIKAEDIMKQDSVWDQIALIQKSFEQGRNFDVERKAVNDLYIITN